MKKKIVLWVLTISCFLLIFIFSAQPSALSSEVSTSFTEAVLGQLPYIQDLSEFERTAEMQRLQEIVRSAAHVFIFLVLGVFISLLLLQYNIKRRYLFAIGICVFYAVFDELHQGLFSAGRACEVIDLVKDWSGSLIGISAVELVNKIKSKKLHP